MRKKKFLSAMLFAIVTFVSFYLGSSSVLASGTLLKNGMEGKAVTELQSNLKKLGYFTAAPTGYYGDLTTAAVRKLQTGHGLAGDGIAGSNTLNLISKLMKGSGNSASSRSTTARSGLLKKGTRGNAVTGLQSNLKKLGYFSASPTGYYGSATEAAVKKLQKKYGYAADGIAGAKTLGLVDKLLGNRSVSAASASTASRGSKQQSGYLLPWFSEASKVFARGKVATVYDIESGLSFKIKRTYGTNHADCETVSAKDTETMKKVFGGWSWARRAVIITVGGTRIAASMAGMPHAGNEKYAANRYISSRSGGYGRGTNLDSVKGNSMSGHFDVHFYGSKTHGTNRVDSAHQAMVKKAAEWAKKNY